jgi:hypothetical protein
MLTTGNLRVFLSVIIIIILIALMMSLIIILTIFLVPCIFSQGIAGQIIYARTFLFNTLLARRYLNQYEVNTFLSSRHLEGCYGENYMLVDPSLRRGMIWRKLHVVGLVASEGDDMEKFTCCWTRRFGGSLQLCQSTQSACCHIIFCHAIMWTLETFPLFFLSNFFQWVLCTVCPMMKYEGELCWITTT